MNVELLIPVVVVVLGVSFAIPVLRARGMKHGLLAAHPGASVVLAQVTRDLDDQIRALTGDLSFVGFTRWDAFVALVVDAGTVGLFGRANSEPTFSLPIDQLSEITVAEHTNQWQLTGKPSSTRPCLRLTFTGAHGRRQLDLAPLGDPLYLAAITNTQRLRAIVFKLRRAAEMPVAP